MIANPRRLLSAFTFAPDPYHKCWVVGCYNEAVVGILHPRFGRSIACAGHNPLKHSIGKPFGQVRVPAAPVEAPKPNPIGGQTVPRIPFLPRRPSPSAVVNPF